MAQVHELSVSQDVRLPKSLVPKHYSLYLEPNFYNFTFKGKVTIDIEAKDSSASNILLNSSELKINSGHFKVSDKLSSVSKVIYGKDDEKVKLEFNNSGPLSSGQLFLEFEGELNDRMKGFYRTSWSTNPDHTYAVTTQFEATDARRCFPCWDEPAFKATFQLEVGFKNPMPDGETPYLALSNMPIKNFVVGEDNFQHYTFESSPIMSTYLLALCVGPFEYIEQLDYKNRSIRVYTMPNKKAQGKYALEVAVKSLKYYEEYFNIPYPLPKMDLVAIPDFSAGAMENWGLVTYRETCLLVDDKQTATARKQNVALTVAHELAHQWFGNLVTMEWWTDLWLNEGFASFMEYLCVDDIFPEYQIWSQFVTDMYCRALSLDALNNSHPIEVPVNHPTEIDEIFDDISYAKGASVIRMLHNYIGDECFRKGMKNYLNKYAYSNSHTVNLWQCLGEASGKPVDKIMGGWTSYKGYPWLSVSSSKEGESVKLTLTQSKFSADGKLTGEDEKSLWMIPINVSTETSPDKAVYQTLMTKKEETITIDNVGNDWLKLNPGTINLFRAAYPEDISALLRSAIQRKDLPPLDRLGLQDDNFALCQAGKVTTVDVLKLISSFANEDDFTVWCSIDGCVGSLLSLLLNTDFKVQLYPYVREIYSEIFRTVGWDAKENEPHTRPMTRALVINRLINVEHEEVLQEAIRRYKDQLANPEKSIKADLRNAVYVAVAIHGDDSDFDSLFAIYRSAQLHEEKNRAARALGFARDKKRLERAMAFAMSDEVRNQDKVFIIAPIGMTDPEYAFNFLKTHKDFIRETYQSSFLIGRIIKCATENFGSEEKAKEVEEFFEANKFPGAERTIQQALETIRLNSEWLKRDAEATREFLKTYNP